MTARIAIILWVASAVLLPVLGAIGALFKIQHWPLAWVFELLGWCFSAIMTLIVAAKFLRYPGFKDFLDS